MVGVGERGEDSQYLDADRNRLLPAFIRLGLFFGVYYTFQSGLLGARYLPIVHMISVASMLGSWALFKWAKRKTLASAAFLISLHNILLFSSLFDGMLSAHGLWTVSVLPMAAAFLMNLRVTIAVSVVAFLDLLFIAWVDAYAPITREIEPTSGPVLIILVFTVFLFSVFSYLALTGSHRKIGALEFRTTQLEQANLESLRAFQDKEAFLAKMSHELRTPMNGLLGHLQDMKAKSGEEHSQDLLRAMNRDAQNLLVALNTCIEASSSGSSPLHRRVQPTDLGPHLTRICSELGRKHYPNRVLTSNGRIACLLDHERTERVLDNILSELDEAGGDHGCIYAWVVEDEGAREQSASESYLHVQILPQGVTPGLHWSVLQSHCGDVSLRMLPHGDDAEDLRRAATLQLIKEMRGGAIYDPQDESVLVGFWLHYEPVALEQLPGQCELDETPQGVRALVVDDNAINLKVASLLLRRLGCEVCVAEDGEHAVMQAEARRFDIIFMDMRMPVMNGIEATRAIRAGVGPNVDTPIVALTANAHTTDREACLLAGMNDHLAKPVSPRKVQQVLARFVGSPAIVEKGERSCA